MRIALLCAVLATVLALGCGGSSKEPAAWPAARFLPASADVVVHLDLPKLRAWPHYDQAAASALAGIQDLLEAGKRTCDLDLMAEASTVVVARKGALLSGDVTLIARGLDPAKVTGCLQAISTATPAVKIAKDGDVFHVEASGRALASGAFLPGGDLVVVSRAGAGIPPDAWKTEVGAAGGAAPAYWAELDAKAPVAILAADATRTLLASAQLGPPLVIRGKLVAGSAAQGKEEAARMTAMAKYLETAKTGTARIEPNGAIIHADFTVTDAQIESFVKIALPAAVGGSPPPRDLLADLIGTPGDCSQLAGAVESYLTESLSKSPASRRAELEAQMPQLVPALQKSYVDACTADAWSASVVNCHVAQATALARFERCRLLLPEDKRARFDQAVAAALQPFTP